MRAKMFGALIAVLAISAFAVVPAMGATDPHEAASTTEAPASGGENSTLSESATPLAPQGCVELYVCAYSQENYEGTRYLFACSNYGEIGGAYMRSATNRCGNKANLLKIGGSILACMNPGGNRPSPGLFTSVFIEAAGSRC